MQIRILEKGVYRKANLILETCDFFLGGQLVEAGTDPNRTLTEEKSDDSGDDNLQDPEGKAW